VGNNTGPNVVANPRINARIGTFEQVDEPFMRFYCYFCRTLNRTFNLLFLVVLIVSACVISSCRQQNEIGLNTQPGTDQLKTLFCDTSTVRSYVIPDDSLQTNENFLIMIGSYVDPVFGKTAASLYAQLSLQNEAELDLSGGQGFGVVNYGLVLDSAVMCLEYTTTATDGRKYYGNLDPQTFNVYALAPGVAMVPDSPYYAGRTFPTGILLGSKTFVPSPDSNTTLGSASYHINNFPPYTLVYPPHVRIKLNTKWVQDNIISQNNGVNLSTSTLFHNYFPGVYITADNSHPAQGNGKGAIFYFDPHGGNTGLTLYYRRNQGAGQVVGIGDTLIYTFPINGNSAYFNHYNHNNYSQTPIASSLNTNSVQYLVTQNPALDQKTIYLQSMGGVRTLITLPYLMNWKSNGMIAVNQAQFIFHVDASTVTPAYNANPNIYLVAVDSSYRTYYFPIDYSDNNSLYGGGYNSITSEYTFNITRHIQQLLTGARKYYGFYLLAGGTTVNAQRVILSGATKNNNNLRFRLSYTPLHPPSHP
jgi:hypothetical protein